MAKESLFKAYDLRRKNQHQITAPPTKISEHRLRAGEWRVAKPQGEQPSRKRARKTRTKAAKSEKVPKRAIDILRCDSFEIQCLYCGEFGDKPSCGTKCYRSFRKESLTPIEKLIEIRGPSPLGYGAFTRPGNTLKKGQWIGEYVGELRPLAALASLYRFEIPGVCTVDSEAAGNWTRFINSHCRPNVKPWGEFVGKRHGVYFQVLRDIGPGEEICFAYGGRYFEAAGFLCQCDAVERGHMPKGATKKKT